MDGLRADVQVVFQFTVLRRSLNRTVGKRPVSVTCNGQTIEFTAGILHADTAPNKVVRVVVQTKNIGVRAVVSIRDARTAGSLAEANVDQVRRVLLEGKVRVCFVRPAARFVHDGGFRAGIQVGDENRDAVVKVFAEFERHVLFGLNDGRVSVRTVRSPGTAVLRVRGVVHVQAVLGNGTSVGRVEGTAIERASPRASGVEHKVDVFPADVDRASAESVVRVDDHAVRSAGIAERSPAGVGIRTGKVDRHGTAFAFVKREFPGPGDVSGESNGVGLGCVSAADRNVRSLDLNVLGNGERVRLIHDDAVFQRNGSFSQRRTVVNIVDVSGRISKDRPAGVRVVGVREVGAVGNDHLDVARDGPADCGIHRQDRRIACAGTGDGPAVRETGSGEFRGGQVKRFAGVDRDGPRSECAGRRDAQVVVHDRVGVVVSRIGQDDP